MCVTHWLLVPLQKQGSPPRQSSPCLAGMYGATQGRVHPQTGVIHKQGTGPWKKPQQSPIPSLHRALLKPWCWCYCCALGSVMASGGGVPGKNIETNNTIKFLQQNWNKKKKSAHPWMIFLDLTYKNHLLQALIWGRLLRHLAWPNREATCVRS